MKEKERTTQQDRKTILFFGVASFIMLICFFLFVPKVASDLFPFKRQLLWNNFLNTTKKENHIDAQTFWEFREFYSSGSFMRFMTAGTTEVTTALRPYGVTTTSPFRTLLSFTSANITSIDSLTTESQLTKSITTFPKGTVLYQDTNAIIIKIDDHHAFVSFIKPVMEMQLANGFFDYNDKDKELVKNKYWFTIMKVTLP